MVRPRPLEPAADLPEDGGGGADRGVVLPAVNVGAVKRLLREFDCAGRGEAFRGDRLAKIAVIGKGSTSTVWKVVDVDTLRVVAVKEMLVSDSKQSAVLRHELGVLHPQLQPLVPPRGKHSSGRRSRGVSTPAVARSKTCAAATAAMAMDYGSSHRKHSGSSSSSSSSSQRNISGISSFCRDTGAGREGGGGGGSGDQVVHPGACPYMPRYFGSFISEDDVGRPRANIVLEYVPGVDLARWIREVGGSSSNTATGSTSRRRKKNSIRRNHSSGSGGGGGSGGEARAPPRLPLQQVPAPEPWLAQVCRDMLEALRYLHARRRVHRDVKPANLLLGPEGARLADFGSTVGLDEEEGDRMHGTVRFMSPERLSAGPSLPSSDLWAAGLTLASAALGENPLPHSSNTFEAAEHAESAFGRVVDHPAAAGLSPGLLDFLKAVLVSNPDERPTVEEMLSHPFLNPGSSAGALGTSAGGSGGGGGGGGSGAGSDFFAAVMRGVSMSIAGFRSRGGERVPTATAAAAATEDEQNRQQQQQQQPPQTMSNTLGSSSKAGGCDGLGETWGEGARHTLRRLARESTADVDASEVIRRVLAARWSRWGHVAGSGFGLRGLDFSHLAAELDLSTAELRSLFGSVASNMDEEASASASPGPVMLPPLGAGSRYRGGSSIGNESNGPEHPSEVQGGRKVGGGGGGGGGGERVSPLRSQLPQRRPLSRRRPPPLVTTPGSLSSPPDLPLAGPTRHSPPPMPSTAAVVAPAAHGSELELQYPLLLPSRKQPADGRVACPPARNSSAPWRWGWPGKNRGRRSVRRAKSVRGVTVSGGPSGSHGVAWWRGWGQKWRLSRPSVPKAGRCGLVGDAEGGGDVILEVIATELSSGSLGTPPQPLYSITPPLSRFDEEADGSAGGGDGGAKAAAAGFRGASPGAPELAGVAVSAMIPARAAQLREPAPVRRAIGGTAPAWGTSSAW